MSVGHSHRTLFGAGAAMLLVGASEAGEARRRHTRTPSCWR
jgi:hypothetical protein